MKKILAVILIALFSVSVFAAEPATTTGANAKASTAKVKKHKKTKKVKKPKTTPAATTK